MKQFTLLFLSAFLLLSVNTLKAQNAPDAPLIARINHIAVYVHDLEKSRAFYEEVIQLKRIPEPFKDGRHEWFSIGGPAHLHLIKGADAITEHNKNAHICFSVASVNDFITNLKKHAVPYESWKGEPNTVTDRVDGVKQIYFQDPDGYWIEINDDNNG